ncbi:hypothetical protein D3C72_2219010 [compost metagenome]
MHQQLGLRRRVQRDGGGKHQQILLNALLCIWPLNLVLNLRLPSLASQLLQGPGDHNIGVVPDQL